MSTTPNGHDRGRRRLEDRRREAIEYLNAPPELYADRDARARNARIARHCSALEVQVPRAPRRDCADMAHRIVAGELTRPEARAVLRERWEGGNVTRPGVPDGR